MCGSVCDSVESVESVECVVVCVIVWRVCSVW